MRNKVIFSYLFSDDLYYPAIEPLFKAIDTLAYGDEATIVLVWPNLCSPPDVLMLIAIVDEAWKRTGKRVSIEAPFVESYFDLERRYHFSAVQSRADLICTTLPQQVTINCEKYICIPTCKIGEGNFKLIDVQAKIKRSFNKSTASDDKLRCSIMDLASILINNALEHSETGYCYFTLQQLEKKDDYCRNRIATYIVVSDSGCGIPATVCGKTETIARNDAEYIKMMLDTNYSIPGESFYRGYKNAVDIVSKHPKARLFVRSGSGAVTLEKNIITTDTYSVSISGTQVYVLI